MPVMRGFGMPPALLKGGEPSRGDVLDGLGWACRVGVVVVGNCAGGFGGGLGTVTTVMG
jgi:hypothetical protein